MDRGPKDFDFQGELDRANLGSAACHAEVRRFQPFRSLKPRKSTLSVRQGAAHNPVCAVAASRRRDRSVAARAAGSLSDRRDPVPAGRRAVICRMVPVRKQPASVPAVAYPGRRRSRVPSRPPKSSPRPCLAVATSVATSSSVQCVQCVQQTDQFGRFGRPWKHLRALYRVEGLVDFMVRGGSSPLGRTGRAPHRQSVLTGLWQTPCRVGSEQPRIVDRRRCGSGHRPRGCGRIRTVGIGRVGCDSATVFDIPEARQGGATRKLSPERDSTQLRIVPTGPTSP